MLKEGSLLYFDPFVFKNGSTPKPKYFVVLAAVENKRVLLASLPTSQDHVPSDVEVVRGCVSIPERNVNVFVFEKGDQITELFSFHLRTFVYGEQVDEYSEDYLVGMSENVTNLGLMNSDLLRALKECLKQATNIKRKYRKWL